MVRRNIFQTEKVQNISRHPPNPVFDLQTKAIINVRNNCSDRRFGELSREDADRYRIVAGLAQLSTSAIVSRRQLAASACISGDG